MFCARECIGVGAPIFARGFECRHGCIENEIEAWPRHLRCGICSLQSRHKSAQAPLSSKQNFLPLPIDSASFQPICVKGMLSNFIFKTSAQTSLRKILRNGLAEVDKFPLSEVEIVFFSYTHVCWSRHELASDENLESLTRREASTATSPLHPTNQCTARE